MIIRQREIPVKPLGDKPVQVKALLTRRAHTESISVSWIHMAGRCCQEMTCNLSDRVYYVLSGDGEFQVGDNPAETASEGDLVYIPKGVPYVFGGTMTYLVMNAPAFLEGSDITVE